jgi:hypothetical protein
MLVDIRTPIGLAPLGIPIPAPRDLPVYAKDEQRLNSAMHQVQSAI